MVKGQNSKSLHHFNITVTSANYDKNEETERIKLKALTESATGMTDRQCEVNNKMWGLRGGSELTTTRVAKQVSAGRSWMYDWTGEIPATVSSYHGARSCAGSRVSQATANAWCWRKEAATKSWRRDLQELVSSLFLGMADNMTISTHGAFSTGRVPVGRGQ